MVKIKFIFVISYFLLNKYVKEKMYRVCSFMYALCALMMNINLIKYMYKLKLLSHFARKLLLFLFLQ